MENLWPLAASPQALELGEVKHHLRVDFNHDDVFIDNLIDAAREYVESATSRTIMHRQRLLTRPCWPSCGRLELPLPPLASVEKVEYYDAAEVLTEFPTANYIVVRDEFQPGAIVLRSGVEWPELFERPDAVQIEFTAGFAASPASVPPRIKQAMLLLIGQWYANRESVVAGTVPKEMEHGLEAILDSLWVGNVAGGRE